MFDSMHAKIAQCKAHLHLLSWNDLENTLSSRNTELNVLYEALMSVKLQKWVDCSMYWADLGDVRDPALRAWFSRLLSMTFCDYAQRKRTCAVFTSLPNFMSRLGTTPAQHAP